MLKKVIIGNNEYTMKSSAYTMFAYKDKMGRDLITDISSINDIYSKVKKTKNQTALMPDLMNIIETTLNLAYIMIKENDPNFEEFNDWLKEQDGILESQDWIMEVLECGMSPFQRGIFNPKK